MVPLWIPAILLYSLAFLAINLILENTGSTDNTFNVNYYERKEIFEMIGDSEEVSGSMLTGGSNKVFIDFNDISNFKQRNYFLENRKGFGYKSYVPQKGGGGGSFALLIPYL